MVDEIHDGLDSYISSSLKNWSVKQNPSDQLREQILSEVASCSLRKTSALAFFFVSLANRWASSDDQVYSHRYWQNSGASAQPVIWSGHFAYQLRLVQ